MHGKEWVAFGGSHCVLLIRERHCKLAQLWSFNIWLHDREVDKRSFEALKESHEDGARSDGRERTASLHTTSTASQPENQMTFKKG
jgi:hypothetical protein